MATSSLIGQPKFNSKEHLIRDVLLGMQTKSLCQAMPRRISSVANQTPDMRKSLVFMTFSAHKSNGTLQDNPFLCWHADDAKVSRVFTVILHPLHPRERSKEQSNTAPLPRLPPRAIHNNTRLRHRSLPKTGPPLPDTQHLVLTTFFTPPTPPSSLFPAPLPPSVSPPAPALTSSFPSPSWPSHTLFPPRSSPAPSPLMPQQ